MTKGSRADSGDISDRQTDLRVQNRQRLRRPRHDPHGRRFAAFVLIAVWMALCGGVGGRQGRRVSDGIEKPPTSFGGCARDLRGGWHGPSIVAESIRVQTLVDGL